MDYQLGLVGYPVKHSLSPWIHNQFLEKTNLKGTYSLIEVKPEQFEEKIKKILQSNIHGFNVTIPFKREIIPYLHQLDDHATKIGAVNTVINENGKWVGYNTDGQGYIRSLEEEFSDLFLKKDSRILILGAGGAARSIYYAFSKSGFQNVDIANRTPDKAIDIKGLRDINTATNIMMLHEAENAIQQFDLIVQTTSVGMNEEKSIIRLENLNESTVVSDIVYQPIVTDFLKQALGIGANIHLGHSMLLFQAQYAFEIWTNKKVQVKEMKKQLQTILEGKQHVNR